VSIHTRKNPLIKPLLLLMLAALPAHGASTFTLTELGTLGGTLSFSEGINLQGQVAGWSLTAIAEEHASLWQGGIPTDLSGPLGGSLARAYDINANGQVVGRIKSATNDYHAAPWQNGSVIDLGTLGGFVSAAYGINNNGQVVGEAQTSSGIYHASLWQNGTAIDLGISGVGRSQATDINNLGQVVGYAQAFGGVNHATLWQNGQATDLGAFSSSASYARAINDNGQAVGYYALTGYGNHALTWDNNGYFAYLSELPGYSESYAMDINAYGQIIGYVSNGSSNSTNHIAVLWQDNQIINLNSLLASNGWVLLEARAINDSGQIAGLGTNPQGFQHGFLLTPVPIPAAFSLFGPALAGIFWLGRQGNRMKPS